jgi:hypothetical protein
MLRIWTILHRTVLALLTGLTTFDAAVWMGTGVPDRLESAAICGFVAAFLWLFIGSAVYRLLE